MTNIEEDLASNISFYQEQVMRISFLAEELSLILSKNYDKRSDNESKIIFIDPSFLNELSEINVESLETEQYLNLLESLLDSVKSLIDSNLKNLHNRHLLNHLKNCYNSVITTTKASILNNMPETDDPNLIA